MFSSNPLDKSCIGPDCSSGRSNASNRFPVGITSLGDENQIRIQLAVHKYNSSANAPLNTRCTVISPFRHSFLNNSLKTKNYEGEAEGISKGEKRNGNQYEGVGAFPTIHLKKSAVRYRPIKRLNDTKISYPELPVNRFLSNLPEACTDPKSTTRSVLDVLEDLSGKKIHSKDDNGNNKSKSKGLGGDYLLNQNAVYKPLFVQKPKISAVLTRDNTTQTLSAPDTEMPSSKNSNSFVRNDISDPKAELRRKLAKQNNEIFASLSSSISSSFSLKRKIDKVTPAGDDESLSDGSATKNMKMDHPNYYNGNGTPKSLNRIKTYSRDSIKLNRKSQLNEANSPTSPNKDRLTTIFLDMQNTSRKSQIFPNAPETKSTEDVSQAPTNLSNGFTSASNGFDNKIPNSLVKGSTGTSAVEDSTDKSGFKNSSCLSFTEKTATDVKKPESDQLSKPVFNFPINQVNTTTSNIPKSTSATFQFGINSDPGVSEKSVQSNSNNDDTSKKPVNDSNAEKKNDQHLESSKPFTFGTSNEKPNFSSFKFGTDSSSSSTVSLSPKDSKTLTFETVHVTATTMPITTPQFCFGANSNATTSAPQFDVKGAQSTLAAHSKSLFSFGQNSSPAQQTSGSMGTQVKMTAANSLSTTTQNIQSVPFNFGGKSNVDSPVQTTSGQTVASESSPTNQTTTSTLSPIVSSPNAAAAAAPTSKTVFSFGQKTETPTTSAASGTTTQEPKFTFTFGQKPGVDQNKPQQEFGQKSTNFFSFGQKSVSQESQNTAVTAAVTSASQPATSQTTSVFGQNVPQATSSPQVKFGQMSPPQITSNFGAKSEGGTLGSMSTPALSQCNSSFPIKTSLFGPSANGFGSSSIQTTAGLKTSTSNASNFGFGGSATTQSAPTFGVSSASQTAPTFGGSTSQSVSGFGGSSTSQSTSAFGTSVSTPAFGISVTAQSTSTFPVSSTAQSGSSFGATSTTQSVPTFGAVSSSQSTPSSNPTFATSSTPQATLGFGTSTTTQSTPAFGASAGFGVSTSSQSSNVFGAPAPTQSAVRFGTPIAQNISSFGPSTCFSSASSTQPNTTFGSPSATSTSGFGASQTFAQPFNNKPTSSLRQTSSIFGQNPAPSFSSSSTFNSNQNSVFGQKANSEGDIFDQNKIQAQGFGTTSQSFGNQNKFPFGMSTSNATNFTTSPPNTTSPPVFSFGSSSGTANTFTFGGGTSMPSNTQTSFAFKSPTNEPFKFGATAATTKEGPGFGGSNAGTFNFGGQMNNNNNAIAEQKPSFSFGSAQVSSSQPFAFGTTPSPSVFSFGSSGSASSGSSFNFGTPTPVGTFGQTPSSSPGAPFPVPGTFSIGSGSSQSRPRATSRPRRRP